MRKLKRRYHILGLAKNPVISVRGQSCVLGVVFYINNEGASFSRRVEILNLTWLL